MRKSGSIAPICSFVEILDERILPMFPPSSRKAGSSVKIIGTAVIAVILCSSITPDRALKMPANIITIADCITIFFFEPSRMTIMSNVLSPLNTIIMSMTARVMTKTLARII